MPNLSESRFCADNPAMAAQNLLSERFGIEGSPHLLLITGDEQQVLGRAEELTAKLEEYQHRGIIKSIFSPTILLPSVRTQNERASLLASVNLAASARALEEALRENGFRIEPVQPFIDRLRQIGERIAAAPEGFNIHKTILRFLENRRAAIRSGEGIDWATGGALAFGSLLLEGHRVRLSGEDSQRGTFSQRHAVLVDQTNQNEYVPLNNIRAEQAKIEIYNSLLSEVGVDVVQGGKDL